MTLRVFVEVTDRKLKTILVFEDDRCIGEYERAIESEVERKHREILNAAPLLKKIAKEYGPFKVRWNGARRTKVVTVGGREIATIPRDLWELPAGTSKGSMRRS